MSISKNLRNLDNEVKKKLFHEVIIFFNENILFLLIKCFLRKNSSCLKNKYHHNFCVAIYKIKEIH
jgi:hypothetical protein